MSTDERLARIAGINPTRTRPDSASRTSSRRDPAIRACTRTRFPLDHRHGRFALGACLDDAPDTLAPLGCDLGITAVDPRAIAFFDTETTGLEGGAGCRVFLVGLGWFEDDAFVVEQHTLTDLADEPRYLTAVRDAFARFRGVATFFGKSFDRPRLEDRYAYHGFRDHVPNDPHVDLHTLARRLWGDRLANCRLQTIERRILDFHRDDDLPSGDCPEAWWSYIRGDDGDTLARVLQHNLDDILSLATLAHACGRATASPQSARAQTTVAAGLDALGRGDDALALLTAAFAAVDDATRPVDRTGVGIALAEALKRRGRHGDAAAIWSTMLARNDGGIRPLVELAMHHEHRTGDLDRALDYTLRALRRVRPGDDAALRHRAKRLLRKGGRAAPEEPMPQPPTDDGLVDGDGTLGARLPLASLRRRGQDLDVAPVDAEPPVEEKGDHLG